MQVNTWGGTTKEFEVEVDLHKLDAYNVTLPQVISAIGNANINVGGRDDQFRPAVRQYPRASALSTAAAMTILTQGYHVSTTSRTSSWPIERRARQGQGRRQGLCRLCAAARQAGRDHEDDVVAAIVVMNRTLHTNDVVPRIKAEIEKINTDGTLPPGVKLVPFYDRTTLVTVTTPRCCTTSSSVVCWCSSIQWIFLGNLRSAIIVGVNIPFALFFSIIILVLRGQDANLLVGRRRRFRDHRRFGGDPGREHFPQFSGQPGRPGAASAGTRGGTIRRPIRRAARGTSAWTDRLRMIFVSALQVDKAVLFSAAITVAAFVPLFTMQGVEGQIFGPMARTYGYALVGALDRDLHRHAGARFYLLPEHVEEAETIRRARSCAHVYTPVLRWSLATARPWSRSPPVVSGVLRPPGAAARQRVPAGARRRQSLDPRHDAADDFAGGGHADRQQDARDFAAPPGSDHRCLPAWPA